MPGVSVRLEDFTNLFQLGPRLNDLIELDRHCLPAEAWDRDRWIRFIEAGVLVTLAFEGPVLVGFQAFRNVIDETELLKLGVDQSWRRKGLGSYIVSHLMDAMPPEHRLFLEVRKSNQPAQVLYRKLGFTDLGHRRNYYLNPREDALIFSYQKK